MNGRLQRRHQRPTAHAKRQQALLVRAVVGSLVLCALFGAPVAAQTQSAPVSLVEGLASLPRDSNIKLDRAIDTKKLRQALAEIRRLAQAGELDLDSDLHLKALAEAHNAPDETLWYSIHVNGQPGSDERWFKPLAGLIVELRDSYVLQHLTTSQNVKLELKLDRQNAVLYLDAAYPSTERASQIANYYVGFFDRMRAAHPDADEVVVLNNMTVSASGKHLTMQLEMSREMVGNLLRQQLSLP
jgi:hypothetical protein